MNLADILPTLFLLLMGLAVLMYAVLDGYDLGVGMLLPRDKLAYRHQMIASIGPFWDANETWLVLAVGILLIAFPGAYNRILHELYLAAVIMLMGLILRGVSFDFRAKAITRFQPLWDRLFRLGSWVVALSQGWMLGLYVTGFDYRIESLAFAALSAVGVTAAYIYIGGAWLVLKTEGELQRWAARKTRLAGAMAALGIVAICIVNPWINPSVAARWFTLPEALLLFPIPLGCGLAMIVSDQYLKHVPVSGDKACWIPFSCAATTFTLCLFGLVYSFYPYVIPNTLLAGEAASSTAALEFVFYGVAVVLPLVLVYTLAAYRMFKGKTTELSYY